MINKVFPFVLLCSMFSPLGTFQEKILVNLTSQSSKVLTDFEGIKRLETQQVEKVSSQKYFPEDAFTYNTLEYLTSPTYVGIETANEEASMNIINEAFLLPNKNESFDVQPCLLQYILDVERFEQNRDRANPPYLIADKVIRVSPSQEKK